MILDFETIATFVTGVAGSSGLVAVFTYLSGRKKLQNEREANRLAAKAEATKMKDALELKIRGDNHDDSQRLLTITQAALEKAQADLIKEREEGDAKETMYQERIEAFNEKVIGLMRQHTVCDTKLTALQRQYDQNAVIWESKFKTQQQQIERLTEMVFKFSDELPRNTPVS